MLFAQIEEVMYYFLYDLRDNPSIADIHLPTAHEEGPVLLLTNSEDCVGIFTELTEMGENEGSDWLISVIYVPEHSPNNVSDLLINTPYLLIAHYALIREDPEDFSAQLLKMKRWVPN
jgi:hypothetical protein